MSTDNGMKLEEHCVKLMMCWSPRSGETQRERSSTPMCKIRFAPFAHHTNIRNNVNKENRLIKK